MNLTKTQKDAIKAAYGEDSAKADKVISQLETITGLRIFDNEGKLTVSTVELEDKINKKVTIIDKELEKILSGYTFEQLETVQKWVDMKISALLDTKEKELEAELNRIKALKLKKQ